MPDLKDKVPDSKDVTTVVDTNTVVEVVDKVTEVKVLTQVEIDAILAENAKLKKDTSGLDKKITELYKEQKAREELEELKKKETMSIDEKKAYELDEKMKLIDEYQEKILQNNFKDFATEQLVKNGLSSTFAEYVMADSNAAIELKVAKFKDNLAQENINKQKAKVTANSHTTTANQGVGEDLDKETLMRKEIDELMKNGNRDDAIKKQFMLKQIRRENEARNVK